ncbi:hypothetical protein SFRURICE_020464 [Spodoptera frugiperda]|nr:hypothetical protein SFRURICE_020464 [Spodoptera frugiperda]
MHIKRYILLLYNVHPLFTICILNPIITLPDSEIEHETPCSAVTLATTRPRPVFCIMKLYLLHATNSFILSYLHTDVTLPPKNRIH